MFLYNKKYNLNKYYKIIKEYLSIFSLEELQYFSDKIYNFFNIKNNIININMLSNINNKSKLLEIFYMDNIKDSDIRDNIINYITS